MKNTLILITFWFCSLTCYLKALFCLHSIDFNDLKGSAEAIVDTILFVSYGLGFTLLLTFIS